MLFRSPPGCTHRPTRNLTSRHSPQDTSGRRHLQSLPSRTGWRGVSRFEPNQPPRRGSRRWSEIRSSPVYAGHMIKPLRNIDYLAGACSLGQDRGLPASRTTPAASPDPKRINSPSFRVSKPDVLKKEWISCIRAFGMRTRTRQRQPARPEAAV